MTVDFASANCGPAIDTPGASETASLTDVLARLRAMLAQTSIQATLAGTDQVGGQDAYHMKFAVPLDKLNAHLATAVPSGHPPVKIDSATLDSWVYTGTFRLARVELKAASETTGSIDFVTTMTRYDIPVKIVAPPAASVQSATR